MPLTEEEVKQIAKCRVACMFAGMAFAESKAREPRFSPAITPMAVAGLVPAHDLVVPHSELAMYVGAAGHELMAWALTEDGRYAQIVYADGGGCCAFTHGLPTEVMTPGPVRKSKELMGIKE